MTRKEAFAIALNSVDNEDARTIIAKALEQVSRPHGSAEARSAAAAKRREKNAIMRAELVAKVAPVLREALALAPDGLTAAELYENTASLLPIDFTSRKVQYMLVNEMADEIEKIATKRVNVYRLKTKE